MCICAYFIIQKSTIFLFPDKTNSQDSFRDFYSSLSHHMIAKLPDVRVQIKGAMDTTVGWIFLGGATCFLSLQFCTFVFSLLFLFWSSSNFSAFIMIMNFGL